jgi:four helix bundle protein
MENAEPFHKQLRELMDEYVHLIYHLTRSFPPEERFGVTSQLRRATLSVILNYIEGYARRRPAVYRNFLQISYGSLQESKYLVDFSFRENYMTEQDYQMAQKFADRIGRMLWGVLNNLPNS